MTDVQTMTPAELARRIAAKDDLVLLDVREPRELLLCRIAGSLAIPMSELSVRHVELDPDRPTVCICHHGIRSANVASALAHLGFAELYNLSGGIDRWAAEVDPGMARY
jgi:rhodanese-related sulfurtransferase